MDLLWHSAGAFGNDEIKRPNWSGYIQHIITGVHPSKPRVHFLPIINMKPTDESCIYSTLTFIESQAKILKIPTASSVTFDQPLWLKAVEITKSKSLNVVCKMGGFHMLMSYLGSVGYVMESNAVNNMSGKAYSRAVRGHIYWEKMYS